MSGIDPTLDLLESALDVELDLVRVGVHQHVLALPVERVGQVVKCVDVGVPEDGGAAWGLVAPAVLRAATLSPV